MKYTEEEKDAIKVAFAEMSKVEHPCKIKDEIKSIKQDFNYAANRFILASENNEPFVVMSAPNADYKGKDYPEHKIKDFGFITTKELKDTFKYGIAYQAQTPRLYCHINACGNYFYSKKEIATNVILAVNEKNQVYIKSCNFL